MATVPTHTTPKVGSETIEDRFRRLASICKSETAQLSSTTARNNHPAYQEIIAMGPAVLPFLLRDLEENETHWFAALRSITGANPIPASDAGDVPKMSSAWLNWAKSQGHRW